MMKLEIDDYESISLKMDDVKYILTKKHLGFTIEREDNESIYVNTHDSDAEIHSPQIVIDNE